MINCVWLIVYVIQIHIVYALYIDTFSFTHLDCFLHETLWLSYKQRDIDIVIIEYRMIYVWTDQRCNKHQCFSLISFQAMWIYDFEMDNTIYVWCSIKWFCRSYEYCSIDTILENDIIDLLFAYCLYCVNGRLVTLMHYADTYLSPHQQWEITSKKITVYC